MKRLNLSIDKNLTENSNILASSQQALKYYIDDKRILVKYLQSTEPEGYSVGDKWLNTSSNKIFTALTSSTWDDGKNLELGQIYSFNNLLYHFDGESVQNYSTESITEQRTGTELKKWVGTQAQYDIITTKDANTEYTITDAYNSPDLLLATQTEFNNSATNKAATPYQVNQKFGNYLALVGGNLNAGAILRLTNSNNEVTPLAYNTSGYLTVGSKLYVDTETNTNSLVVRSGNIYKVNTSGATAIWSDEKGANNGIATLNSSGLVTSTQLPTATVSNVGLVQPDGNTITIDANGVITAIGGGGGGGGDVTVDNTTIVKNGSGVISTIAVREQRASNAIKEWVGTKAQYDSINSKDSNTKYIITDDEGTGIVIDSVLSTTSSNPVQNSTITNAIQSMAVAKTRIVGEIVESTIPLTDAGLHALDGSVIIGNGVYAEFVTYMAGLVSSHSDLFTTEEEWQNSVSSFGICSKYVYDSEDNSIRLPRLISSHGYLVDSYTDGADWYRLYSDGFCVQSRRVILNGNQTSQTANLLKEYKDTNYTILLMASDVSGTTVQGAEYGYGFRTTSTFQYAKAEGYSTENDLNWVTYGYVDTTDLRLNPMYEYVVIATTTNTDVEVDINEIISDLNDKVSNSELGEINCIVETYRSGTEWYRIYSDGWCEQGGFVQGTSNYRKTITFLQEFANADYNVTFGSQHTSSATATNLIETSTKVSTGFTLISSDNSNFSTYWRAEGYIL